MTHSSWEVISHTWDTGFQSGLQYACKQMGMSYVQAMEYWRQFDKERNIPLTKPRTRRSINTKANESRENG